MKLFTLFSAVFLFFSGVAKAKLVENYQYPYPNPYMASLTYELIQNDPKAVSRQVKIPGLESRANVPLLEGRNFTMVNVYKQRNEAPLAFMLTGLGSQATDGGVNQNAEQLYKMGYSVVVFPSPMVWYYILAENPTGVPGYTPDDSEHLYTYMQKVMSVINADQSLKISGYVLAGYSLGAAEAAFISEIDRKEKVFNFEKILLVNPPLDILYAINTLDRLLAVAANWDAKKIDYVQSLVTTVGADLLMRNYKDPKYFMGLEQTPFGNVSYDQYLIGAAFRSTLGDDIFTAQQIKDTGLLKTPAYKGHQSDREEEAHSISFSQYAKDFVVPELSRQHHVVADINLIFQKASVNSLRSELASNPKVFIFHNADDFLDKPADMAAFEKAMGDRMTVFPHGGHLGNIWYSENMKAFEELFKF